MASVCALVLTRNRKALLLECLAGVLGQTEAVARVLVVDNASTDGTRELLCERGLLDRPGLEYLRLEENSGGAGGFAEAVRRGREGEEEWLWLMDDDAEPRTGALAALLAAPEARDPGTVGLASAVHHPDGTIDPLHRGHLGRFMRALAPESYAAGEHPHLGFASFVGLLVRADAARRLELPRAEFFIGCDDVEYCLRLRRHGAIRLVPESVIVHKLGMGGGHATRRSALWNRLLGQSYASASWEGFWKNLYALRNFMWIKHSQGRVSPVAFAGLTATYVVKSLLYDERPLRRIPWIVSYARRGRRGDFSGPSPEQWRRIALGR